MRACILCREESFVDNKRIEIFSIEGVRLNVCSIISKHFWLKPRSGLIHGQIVCIACWESLLAFHQFYQKITEAHNHLETKDIFNGYAEDDPLPQEVTLKTEELHDASQIGEALDESLFYSEIKVEVNDLDLLPPTEVIEGVSDISDRALRASRRRRPLKDATDKSSPITKCIKHETNARKVNKDDSDNNNDDDDDDDDGDDDGDGDGDGDGDDDDDDDDDSEHEMPLSTLLDVDKNSAIVEKKTITSREITLRRVFADEQHKKKRGRPKKIKLETDEENSVSNENHAPSQAQSDSIVKAERTFSCSDDNEFNTGQDQETGTEDTSDSSSDSDDSLPDVEPVEQYAEIPKRVVIKPKKYRKRQKPLVPPKRMTREEIDQKNAQQTKFDETIKQFFEKFACPKCNLLVMDFGTMKKHFRASHDDSGYLMCCGKKFFQRKTLVDHIYVHWNPEHFKCTKCGKICQDSRTLEAHENVHTHPPELKEKKTFQCDKCPKAFTTKAAFEYHAFSKHVDKSEFKFTCPECKKKLPTERKLKDHMKYMHDPESAIICDKCGKKVRSQSNLKKHHEIEHSDVPRPVPVPMQCEICGTWLRHLAGLKQHMKTIHEDSGGEHRCPICNKTSTNARALKRHIYHNHECERKFKCTMCEKAFKRPQDLREHTSTHTGEVLYTCPNCPMTFFSNANMYKHRQRLHRAEWETDRKKPRPPNIMQQAVDATAAMKMQQAVGATSAFFANKTDLRFNTNTIISKEKYL